MQAKITKRLIESLDATVKEITDDELSGFRYVRRGASRGSWQYRYRFNGAKPTLTLGTFPGLEPEGARKAAKKAAGEVAAGIDPQARKKQTRAETKRAALSTLAAFIDNKYAAHASVHLKCGNLAVARLKADFASWLPKQLTQINPPLVEAWRRDRLAAGVMASTLKRQVSALSALLSYAVREEVIASHPLKGLAPLPIADEQRVRFLSPDEELRLRAALIERESDLRASRDSGNRWRLERKVAALPSRTDVFVDHVRPMTLLALNSGLRRGEIFSLRWSDVNFLTKILTVRAAAAKSGKRRDVHLNVEAIQTLTDWKIQAADSDPSALVFPGADGARLVTIKKSWAAVCARAKLVDFRFHDVRHHFASRLVQRGVNLYVVQKLLGHADLSMTQRYAHLGPDEFSAAVALLA